MTKAELVKAFKEATQVTATEAEEYINRLGDIMAAELLGGGEVSLPAIGKLKVQDTAARKGRNPRTGETINIPAGKKLKLSMSKEFKDFLK